MYENSFSIWNFQFPTKKKKKKTHFQNTNPNRKHSKTCSKQYSCKTNHINTPKLKAPNIHSTRTASKVQRAFAMYRLVKYPIPKNHEIKSLTTNLTSLISTVDDLDFIGHGLGCSPAPDRQWVVSFVFANSCRYCCSCTRSCCLCRSHYLPWPSCFVCISSF